MIYFSICFLYCEASEVLERFDLKNIYIYVDLFTFNLI